MSQIEETFPVIEWKISSNTYFQKRSLLVAKAKIP